MLNKIEANQILVVGVPLVISIVAMILGYSGDDKEWEGKISLIILGWGSAFLTVLFAYLEFQFSGHSLSHKYKILQRKGDAFSQVINFLNSAKPGDELFSVATVPASDDYEALLVKKVLELCSSTSNNTVFTRIITNTKIQALQDLADNMINKDHPIYGELSPYIATNKIKILTAHEPSGLDLIFIAGENRKKTLLGIKEESPDLYFNGYGMHISRGKTYIFEDDPFSESIHNYFEKFIKQAMS